MKAVKVDKDVKGFKVTFADEKQEKQKQRQSKLAALAEKKAKGQLKLEDVDAKLDVIIKMLQDLMPPQ